MISTTLMLLAALAQAAPQVDSSSFEAGKSLPLANGQWSFQVTATGSEARFGSQFSLLCDRPTRTVTISRPGMPSAALAIATDTASGTLPPSGRLSADDPLLDAIAFSRGRFVVSGGTEQPLVIPSWPEVARAIENCRN